MTMTVTSEQSAASSIDQFDNTMKEVEVMAKSGTDDKQVATSEVHLLHTSWVFWVWKEEQDREWDECAHRQVTLETIEDFMGLESIVKKPKDLKSGVEYCFFKQGISPSWMDAANTAGGAIFIELPRLYRPLHLNKLMREVLYTLLGNQLPPPIDSTITGVAVNNMRVCVWIDNCKKERVRALAVHLEGKLSANHLTHLKFFPHQDVRGDQKQRGGGGLNSSRGSLRWGEWPTA